MPDDVVMALSTHPHKEWNGQVVWACVDRLGALIYGALVGGVW